MSSQPERELVERARTMAATWLAQRGGISLVSIVKPEALGSLAQAIAAFAAEEAETQTRGQLAATERATETAGKWRRAYEDAYGKLQTTEARAGELMESRDRWQAQAHEFASAIARLEAREARLREAARMMIAEAEGDVTGEYSSPGIRLLRAALAEPRG